MCTTSSRLCPVVVLYHSVFCLQSLAKWYRYTAVDSPAALDRDGGRQTENINKNIFSPRSSATAARWSNPTREGTAGALYRYHQHLGREIVQEHCRGIIYFFTVSVSCVPAAVISGEQSKHGDSSSFFAPLSAAVPTLFFPAQRLQKQRLWRH